VNGFASAQAGVEKSRLFIFIFSTQNRGSPKRGEQVIRQMKNSSELPDQIRVVAKKLLRGFIRSSVAPATLVLHEPDSAVSQGLKEAFLALRQATESAG
jgi:hypothetical protein